MCMFRSYFTSTNTYLKVTRDLDDFFWARNFMWPTLAGNGHDYSGIVGV